MDSSSSYSNLLEASVKKGKKKKSWQSTDSKVDPGFLRDMGYGNKKKKKANS
jgi:hypothetical protein